MALTDIPSIKTIKERIISDIEGKINQNVPANDLSFIKVFAGATAVVIHMLYQAIAWVYKQIFTSTQDKESLLKDGESIGVIYQVATYAVITATVTGDGGSVAAGITFVSNKNVVYRVNSTTAIPGTVVMTALKSGTIGNLSIGDEISLSVSASGVDQIATITELTSTADDDEDIEDYRERVSVRKRTKFFFGSPAGYALSGLEAPNFIWVGPYASETLPGTVNVYGRVDLDLGTDGIPTSPQLAELENYLRYDNGTGQEIRRPINDDLNVLPVVNNEFDITVTVQDVNTMLKAQIEGAIREKVQSYEPYIEGVSLIRNDTMTITDLATVGNAIAAPEGGKLVDVSIVDKLTTSFVSAYTFYGDTFGIVDSVSFVDIA
jgi:uncharacterized phage protein gp47/JayE